MPRQAEADLLYSAPIQVGNRPTLVSPRTASFNVLLIIFLVFVLVLVQVLMPSFFLTKQVGSESQMGPRDDLPEPSQALARSRRALNNLQETLPIFLTLAVLAMVLAEQGWLALLGGALYLVGRVGHVVCYMAGLSPWRSIAFVGSLIGLLVMALPLLPHIWA